MKTVPFAEAITDVSRGNEKIPQSAFLPSGAVPIIDQGRSVVAGYTNDQTSIVHSEPPVIVFGDHTRALKFVDFPFAVGADGVKLLKTRQDFDPKYVYHYLRSRRIPSLGYSRHFKVLKETRVPQPPLEEQRRIATILDQADTIRAKRHQVLAHLGSLTLSIYHEMFGDPAENPQGLPVSPLDELIEAGRPITYGILKPGPEISGGVPYIRVADMKNGGISVPGVRRTDPAISASYKRSLLREGDLLMSIRGHVGRFAQIPPELDGANITQDSARLSITDSATSQYVRASMSAPGLQRWMARHTKGVAVQGLNIGDLRKVPIPLPPIEARLTFEARADRATRQHGTLQRALRADDELFASLQSRAFRGEL
ncbi:restriction endonuclease subunit S [Microbacterium sp. A588]